MGNPLDAALDTLFGSVLAENVIYTDANGSVSTVRAMASLPDVVTPLSHSRVRQEVALFEIRASDLPTEPRVKETIDRTDGSRFNVMSARFKDSRRSIWLIEASLQPQ